MSLKRTAVFLGVALGLLAATPRLQAGPPDDVRAHITAAGDVKKWDADAVVVLDDTQVTVRPSGIGTARRQLVTKILREPGIRSQAVQVFPFDPHTNRLDLVAIRVYRAGGSVEEVPLQPLVEQPQPASGVFWGTRQYLVALPRLAVGDAVETISDMTGFNVAYLAASEAGGDGASVDGERNAVGEVLQPPVSGHWHDEAAFWTTGYPIALKRYSVKAPADKPVQYCVYNGTLKARMVRDGDQLVYTFEAKDLMPLKGESNMEPWPNVAPKLLLATLPSWEDKARWLYQVSEPQLVADDAIKAKVAEIIKGCKTDEEKYTALNHWVAENIRYAGTSRGMCEGYTIHDVKETFHDRAGVCKDKAGMLCGMLRVAGFESYIVMTMARQRVDDIPADQFNHAVTCIRQADGKLVLLDPTWMPKSRDNWSMLEPSQHVVFGVPEGKGLSQSDEFPPERSTVAWKATSTIGADNGLKGSLEFSATGAGEGRLRRTLAGLPPADRSDFFDDTFQRLSPLARPMEVKFLDPVDFSGPMTITCGYEAPEFIVGQGSERLVSLPMLQTVFGNRTLYDLFGDTGTKERKYGLKLMATRLARFEETVNLPSGWKVTRSPERVDLDGPAASLKFEMDVAGSSLHYTCELVVKKWTIPPADYANYKQVIEKFEELAGRVITCQTEAANDKQ